jgi:hypothetical protein
MSTLTSRLIGSAQLNAQSYEEVETDPSASVQALVVVLLSSLAAALGAGIRDLGSTLTLLFVAILSWIIWVLLTLIIGTHLLPEEKTRANFGQLLRTTGFSSTPGILRIFGLVPFVGHLIFAAATIWMLFSFVIAVRQALDYTSTARAVAVCLLGWIIHGVVLFGFVMTAV